MSVTSSELAAMVRRVFDSTAPRTTTRTLVEATVATTKQATIIPMDDPDLTDKEATFQSLRQIIEDQQLIKARLDGLTEALGSIAADVKALATKPVAATTAAPAATVRPFGGGGGGSTVDATGGQKCTLGLVDLVERVIPKNGGGTFTVVSANFSNGWQRDVPKRFIQYFADRVGQEVTFTQAKPPGKRYNEIVSVG